MSVWFKSANKAGNPPDSLQLWTRLAKGPTSRETAGHRLLKETDGIHVRNDDDGGA
tara:strand:- start:581 stop:748 length:168 start_codon:yes stop_codon:yes gene_type:complete